MAEVTGMRNNALPYPVYGAPWAVTFPMLDADGDLVTGATTPDAEVSKNGDTFADCTNESTEIATNSGVYYLLLTGAEMTADIVTVIAKSATAGMKTTVLTFYPRKLVSLRAATAAGGAAGSITLDASASTIDDYYNGCLVVGVLDSATEARIIADYVGSTKVASVTPNWNTTPDSDDTFTIYMPEGMQIKQADTVAFGSTAGTFASGIPETKVASIAASAITATAIASDAITAAKIADGAIDAATFAAGAIDAAAIAANAIGASELAADAVAEIADAIWDEATSGHTTSGTFGEQLKTDVDAILEDTGTTLDGRLPAALVSGRIDASVGAMAANVMTAAAAAADLTTELQSGLSTLTAGQVNAEVVDALATDTYAEPGQGSPAATTTLAAKINYLYKAWRNKHTQTSGEYALYADDGTTKDHEATFTDDGTTATRGEVSTGA